MLQAIFTDVHAFTKGAAQNDDITALVLRYGRYAPRQPGGRRLDLMSRIERRLPDPLVRARIRRLERRLRHAHARHHARLPAAGRAGAGRSRSRRRHANRSSIAAPSTRVAFSTAWALGVFLAGVITMWTYRRFIAERYARCTGTFRRT